MINLIEYRDEKYPILQTEGYAAQYIFPFASKICFGKGYDIGCMKKEWAFPGAIPIDIDFEDPFDALNLPETGVDYIFSSHCLEHLDDWVDVLDYWYDTLKDDGVLFLYLPHYDQKYWRPWNNRKHKNIFTAEILNDYMTDKGYKNIVYTTGKDLNCSFTIMGQK